jgi:hypothetical protein
MSEVALLAYMVQFKSGRTIHLMCEDLQEVLERCADEYPANVIDTIYKEVYCNGSEDE